MTFQCFHDSLDSEEFSSCPIELINKCVPQVLGFSICFVFMNLINYFIVFFNEKVCVLQRKWSLYYSHTLKKWYCRCLFQFSPTFTRNLFERSYVYDHPKYKQIVRYFSHTITRDRYGEKQDPHFHLVFPFMFSKIEDGISKSRRKKKLLKLAIETDIYTKSKSNFNLLKSYKKKDCSTNFFLIRVQAYIQQYYTKWYFPYMCAAILTAKLI